MSFTLEDIQKLKVVQKVSTATKPSSWDKFVSALASDLFLVMLTTYIVLVSQGLVALWKTYYSTGYYAFADLIDVFVSNGGFIIVGFFSRAINAAMKKANTQMQSDLAFVGSVLMRLQNVAVASNDPAVKEAAKLASEDLSKRSSLIWSAVNSSEDAKKT